MPSGPSMPTSPRPVPAHRRFGCPRLHQRSASGSCHVPALKTCACSKKCVSAALYVKVHSAAVLRTIPLLYHNKWQPCAPSTGMLLCMARCAASAPLLHVHVLVQVECIACLRARVYVCVCACMRVCMRASMYACVRACACMCAGCTHVCSRSGRHVYADMHRHAYRHVHIHIHRHAC